MLTEEEQLIVAHREIQVILKRHNLMGFYLIAGREDFKSDIELPPWAILKKRRHSDGSFQVEFRREVEATLPGAYIHEELRDQLAAWYFMVDSMRKETAKRLASVSPQIEAAA